MNERRLRVSVFFIAAALHVFVIFFIAFDVQTNLDQYLQGDRENARIMKLMDFAEIPPVPPALLADDIPRVEDIAEIMIETDTPPIQNVVAAGTVLPHDNVYIPMHLLSVLPQFDEDAVISEIAYPPIALRSGIEGLVILELFVDRTGVVLRAIVLREEPEGRGFGEAAIKAFMGRKGIPAVSNGEAVSCRYRRPVRFQIR
jgi:protein TonB